MFIFIIFFNSTFNFVLSNKAETISNINFFDLIAGSLLFIFLYTIGVYIKFSFQLDSISLGIVFYLFSFFIFDCIILFFYNNFSFLQILFLVNLIWFSYFIFKLRSLKSMFLISVSFASLRLFFNEFNNKLTIDKNIIGDVEAVFFEQAKNIYEGSYFNSITNFVFEGYPQFLSYIQSLFLGLAANNTLYNFYSFTSHIVFYLSLLFFVELKISNLYKFISLSLFSLLLLNSDFLKFLFTTSLMSEGLVSLFSAILIKSVLNNIRNPESIDYKIFLIFGIMYFSKQFNSSIVIVLTLCLFFLKQKNKIILFGLSGLVLKELLYLIVFPDISKDHHIRQMDLVDTILDLLLFRDLQIKNIYLIIQNLWIDKPLVIVFFIFYFSYLYSKLFSKKFEIESDLIFLTVNLNIIFVFLIYISVWKNMELESLIRYFLSYFHLLIVSIFQTIDKTEKQFSNY